MIKEKKWDLMNDGDIDSVASLLKFFLKELPIAVFPDYLCATFLKIFKGEKAMFFHNFSSFTDIIFFPKWLKITSTRILHIVISKSVKSICE